MSGGDPAWSDVVVCCDMSYLTRLAYEMMAVPRGAHPDYDKSKRPVPHAVDFAMQTIMWLIEQGPYMFFAMLDSGTSERQRWHPTYKAFREKTPEYSACYELTLSDIHENFSDIVHVVAAAGWEADDVAATIARETVASGKKCVIVGNDKDYYQLLRPGSVTMRVRKNDSWGRPSWGWMNAQSAVNKWDGLKIEQFVDFQVLTGDDVDNVPGVKGVGDKTAAGLLKQHGSIEAIKAAKIPGKLGENLQEFWPIEPMVRKLITLNDRVDYRIVPLFSDAEPQQIVAGVA